MNCVFTGQIYKSCLIHHRTFSKGRPGWIANPSDNSIKNIDFQQNATGHLVFVSWLRTSIFSQLKTLYLLLFFVAAWIISCDRVNEVTGDVALYLLEEYHTTGDGCPIDESSVVLEPDPLITYDGLTYYDANEYEFGITREVMEVISNMEFPVSGVPFGVTAGGKLVYTGYFWPLYSSLACPWITIDPLFMEINQSLSVQLGYPGAIEGADLPDPRNDPRILDIFRRDGKLIE
jgi:hypothetical protein